MDIPGQAESDKAVVRGAYPWVVVTILLLAYTLSFIDRQIISLLVDPIRADLDISDTQLSLLQGLAFAIFYTLMGIPIANAADRRSRRNIIVWGVAIWSLMTAFCGIAKNYWTLFIGRVGVGVGEAALSPAAYSMLADYFSAKRLSTALAIYGAGPYIGSGLAYILGGKAVAYLDSLDSVSLPLLGQVSNWQAAFVIVGLPGVALAFLIWLVVKEPARRASATPVEEQQADSDYFKDVLPFLVRNRSFYLYHGVGMGAVSLVAYSSLSWLPSFFVRVHGWEVTEVAPALGIVVLICGTAGVVLGGRLADYLQTRRGHTDGSMRSVFYGSLPIAPAVLATTLINSATVSLAFVGVLFFLVAMPFGAGVAALQFATPSGYRAQASATYLFVNNMIGLALGPTLVAVMTDFVFVDDAAVGLSLALVGGVAGLIAAICCWRTLSPLRQLIEVNHETP